MKTLQMQVVGVRNRKTVSDLKLKKTLTQEPDQQLLKITKTIKIKPPKLTPILGQITIIPIKPQNALVKQMLLGKQALKLQGPLRRLKFNTYGGGNNVAGEDNKNYQNYFNTTQKQFLDTIVNPGQDKDKSIGKTQQTKEQYMASKMQEQLISFHRQSESPKKTVNRIKTLPKIDNQSKYVSERNQKIDRPLLSSLDANLKGIKALHFFILRHEQKIPIIAYRAKTKIQVASLTKIMTFYTVYKICQEFNIKCQEAQVKIEQEMTDISGTSASLVEGQIYTVEQLLYGMMLPSGNDASLALAIWGGRVLSKNPDKNWNIIVEMKLFVERMNLEVKQLKMSDSSFGNPHGLPHRSNRTTCEDMAKLCSTCLEIPLFRQVVGTKIYKFKAYDPQHRKKVAFHWQNTNKLLRRPGFIGIKTGITVTAGPCLASAYEFLGKTYIVIIAKCNKPSRRFKQTRKVLKYCLERINHQQEMTKQEMNILKKLGKTNQDIDSDYSQEEPEFNFGTFTQEQIQRRARMLTLI